MTLTKITIDNNVRYVPKVNNQKKELVNQKQQKLVLFHVNKTKKFHKTIKSFLIMFQHQDSNSLNQ